MNARLERKLRLLSGVVAAGIIAGIAFSAAMDRSLIVGIAYGLLISLMLGCIELFVMEGPMLVWLSGLSFTTNLIIRSAIYAAIIMILQSFPLCLPASRHLQRRYRRSLLLCLEYPCRTTLEDHVHRTAPMGVRVLINEILVTWAQLKNGNSKGDFDGNRSPQRDRLQGEGASRPADEDIG
jgi:hypothetical protein